MVMDVKPKILFVLSEGLQSTVIDSQVLQHSRVLGELGVADFTIITLACSDAAYAEAKKSVWKAKEVAQCDVIVLRGVRPGMPFSECLNGRKLIRCVERLNVSYDKIHARTEYSAALCSYLARHSGKGLIWDCRGDFFAERVDRIPAGIKREFWKLVYGTIHHRRLRQVNEWAESAIFVTQVLRDRMQEIWGDKRSFIIPGAASEDLFYFNPVLRQEIRKSLGIEQGTILLVYSGSMLEYQKFPASLRCFDQLKENGVKSHYLVLTAQPDEAKNIIGTRDQVTVTSASLEQMNGYLNAADAAFMIRDDLPLNAVAFPTKFAEYGLCGLPVIMTRTVPDAFKLASQAGNCVSNENIESLKMLSDERRSEIARFYQSRVTKQAQSKLYQELYRSE